MKDSALIKKLRGVYSTSDIDTADFNILDMLYEFGSPLDALMYARLFWPEFIEINGMVFMKETMESEDDRQRLAEVFEQYRRDRTRTEQDFNFFEVPSDLFGKRAGETAERDDYWLAKRLAEMWATRLVALFPQRQFTVKVLSPEETGGEVGIIFYQDKRKRNKILDY